MKYVADNERYEKMIYRNCGHSGLKLPALSLGMWYNFGEKDDFGKAKKMILGAFDSGITHFDLANNYGPPAGSAEKNLGRILKKELKAHRDELVISSKAGYFMHEGPYGIGGGRKYLIQSAEASLKRLGVDRIDLFYSHCYDAQTPVEETAAALDHLVKSGKVLYVGISSYSPEKTAEAELEFKRLGTPFVAHQNVYSLLNRGAEEDGLIDTLHKFGVGMTVFSPLAQGLLTDKYLGGIPKGSRADSKHKPTLSSKDMDANLLEKLKELALIAAERGQSLSSMALAWVLRQDVVSSVVMGASSLKQIRQNLHALDNLSFSDEELKKIDELMKR